MKGVDDIQALKEEKVSYSNDLHDALLAKSGNDFWKSWHSKCGDNKAAPRQVNGVTNDKIIVSNFVEYFNKCCSPNGAEPSDIIYSKYANMCQIYCGLRAQINRLLMPRLLTKLFAY